MPHDVFISYAKEDKRYADAACASLESEGIRCWIAPRDILPGGIWSEKIINAIQQSRVMVLIFSSHANKSDHIKREVNHAIDTGLSVITFRIENVDFTGALEYYLEAVHWLDAVDPPLEKQLKRLNENVKQLLGQSDSRKEIPDRIPPRPPAIPKWWLALGAGLLVVFLTIVIWAVMKSGGGPVVVNDNSPTPTPAKTSDSPPAAGVNQNTNGNSVSSLTRTATPVNPQSPSSSDDSRIAEAARVLGEPNANMIEHVQAIKALEPLAAKSLNNQLKVVSILVTYIRNNAKWQGGTNRSNKPALDDIQAAITVLGRRKWTYKNGENERLELSDLDLRGVVFRIEGMRANFDGATFARTHFDEAILMDTDFQHANFDGTFMLGVDVNGADFCDAAFHPVDKQWKQSEIGMASQTINKKCKP